MNKSLTTALFIIILMAGCMVSFWFTRSQAIAEWKQGNPVWLDNVSGEIVQTEEDFCQWMGEKKQHLMSQRLELAQLLEDPESDDTVILEKVHQISTTHKALLRGVCEHLISMRSVLPVDQQELLRGFCGPTMRGNMRRRGMMRQGQNAQEECLPGVRMGNGYQRGRRQGHCGLTRKLQLTQEQLVIAQEKDPDFDQDVRELQNQLFNERQTLLLLLESGQEPNGQLTEQFEGFINAYNALEQRLITYVLIMRPFFTTEQQKQIIGLCKRNCSDSCDPE